MSDHHTSSRHAYPLGLPVGLDKRRNASYDGPHSYVSEDDCKWYDSHLHLISVYELRPKPYGTELKKWQYVEETDSFVEF